MHKQYNSSRVPYSQVYLLETFLFQEILSISVTANITTHTFTELALRNTRCFRRKCYISLTLFFISPQQLPTLHPLPPFPLSPNNNGTLT